MSLFRKKWEMSSFQEWQGRYITLLGTKTVVTIRKSGILTLKFLESTRAVLHQIWKHRYKRNYSNICFLFERYNLLFYYSEQEKTTLLFISIGEKTENEFSSSIHFLFPVFFFILWPIIVQAILVYNQLFPYNEARYIRYVQKYAHYSVFISKS